MIETLLTLSLNLNIENIKHTEESYRGSGRDREKTELVCDEGEIVFCIFRQDGTKICSCKTLYTASN
jgi:hypothetical protein